MDSSPDGLLSEHQPDQSVITKNRNYIRMNMLKGNLILREIEREREREEFQLECHLNPLKY